MDLFTGQLHSTSYSSHVRMVRKGTRAAGVTFDGLRGIKSFFYINPDNRYVHIPLKKYGSSTHIAYLKTHSDKKPYIFRPDLIQRIEEQRKRDLRELTPYLGKLYHPHASFYSLQEIVRPHVIKKLDAYVDKEFTQVHKEGAERTLSIHPYDGREIIFYLSTKWDPIEAAAYPTYLDEGLSKKPLHRPLLEDVWQLQNESDPHSIIPSDKVLRHLRKLQARNKF